MMNIGIIESNMFGTVAMIDFDCFKKRNDLN